MGGDVAVASVDVLARECAEELLRAFGVDGLPPDAVRRRVASAAARVAVRRLAGKLATYDRLVGEGGLAAGGAWALDQMSRRTEFNAREQVPRTGPLLIASNHPGLADAVALFVAAARSDLRVLALENPMLAALPNTSRALITIPETGPGRRGAVREAAAHLRAGGAVLIFPAGTIEPDPAVQVGAPDALERWSESMDVFARLVPGLVVVPTLVSGVISSTALRHPLTRLRSTKKDRDWLGASLQFLNPARYPVTVRVDFGQALSTGATSPSAQVLATMRHLVHLRTTADAQPARAA
jgi:hypothetical protein